MKIKESIPKNFQLIPEIKKIITPNNKMTIAVPKSGWIKMRQKGKITKTIGKIRKK